MLLQLCLMQQQQQQQLQQQYHIPHNGSSLLAVQTAVAGAVATATHFKRSVHLPGSVQPGAGIAVVYGNVSTSISVL
jgi:hypothetical protein